MYSELYDKESNNEYQTRSLDQHVTQELIDWGLQ